MSVAEITALIMALGLGPILLKLVEGVWSQFTGKFDREAKRVQSIIQARDIAEDERDEEARRRRRIEDYAHALRQDCIQLHGVNPEHIRPWPEYGATPPPYTFPTSAESAPEIPPPRT